MAAASTFGLSPEVAMRRAAPALILWVGGILPFLLAPHGLAQDASGKPVEYPSAEAVAKLLREDPMTLQNWPAWRQRLLDWINDPGDGTTPAFEAAWQFMEGQANLVGELPAPLAKDPVAWYLLGSAYARDGMMDADHRQVRLVQAETALRRSLQLDGRFARAHARLANVLMRQVDAEATGRANGQGNDKLAEAARELAEARRLDPSISLLDPIEGELALDQGRFTDAKKSFQKALERHPKRADFAVGLGWAIVGDRNHSGKR